MFARKAISPGRAGEKKKTKSTELNEFFFPSFIFLPLAPAKRDAFESRRWALSASSVVVRCRRGDLSLPAVIVLFSSSHGVVSTNASGGTRAPEKWRDRRKERKLFVFFALYFYNEQKFSIITETPNRQIRV